MKPKKITEEDVRIAFAEVLIEIIGIQNESKKEEMIHLKTRTKDIDLKPCPGCGAETSALEVRHVNGTTRRFFKHPDNGCVMSSLLRDIPFARKDSNDLIRIWNHDLYDNANKCESIGYLARMAKVTSVFEEIDFSDVINKAWND